MTDGGIEAAYDVALRDISQNEEWKHTVLQQLAQEFERSLHRERSGGRGNLRFTYVEFHEYVKRLNETVAEWDFDVITLDAVKIGGKELMIAKVSLTIPGLGRRQHVGVQSLDNNSGEDALVKGAVSDGLKKAASLFNLGLYMSEKENADSSHPRPPATERPQANQPAPASYGQRNDQAVSVSGKKELTEAAKARGWDQVQLDSVVSKRFNKDHYNLLSNGEAKWLTTAIEQGKIDLPAGEEGIL